MPPLYTAKVGWIKRSESTGVPNEQREHGGFAALKLLDFARVTGQEAQLTRHGQAFAEADIFACKVIFGEHLLKRVPLAAHIRRVLDERPGSRVPRSRFLRELEDTLTEDEAERVLTVMIDWGRYAELLAYDHGSGILSTENPGEEVAGEKNPPA